MQARIFQISDDKDLSHKVFEFRKHIFIDRMGWDLDLSDGVEKDEFDKTYTLYCALLSDEQLVGTFRAIRCDKPYLSARVFPALAKFEKYPITWDYWEISRFAALDPQVSWQLYAAMLDFGWSRQARALVALVDLGHERILRMLGIHVRRYGPPSHVGKTRHGQPIRAVAGEIPLLDQKPTLRAAVTDALSTMEIFDETLVFRPDRISA